MKFVKNRLLVIGLDGATFDLIKPWISDGRLPHLAALSLDTATCMAGRITHCG